LTKAEQVHVRSEIAKAAGVSTGNITKVKQLNDTCVSEIIAALYEDEVSIHWAWKLRNASFEDQRDALGRFRFERELLKDVRKLAARRLRSAVFTLLGEEQKSRPKRLTFEAMSVKYLGSNPLLDSRSQRMRKIGHQAPVNASVRMA
jgi:hypothetical protein